VSSQSIIVKKRERILLAARRLFVNQGFHNTPTTAIAIEAGVANGTLFHYFKTKNDLINTLFREISKSFFDVTTAGVQNEQTIHRKIRLLYYNTVSWALNRPQDFLFVQQFNHSPFISQSTTEETSDLARFYHDLINQGKASGVLKNFPTDLLFQLLTYQQNGVIDFLLKNPGLQQNMNYLNMAFEICWESIMEK
jgi:AcrR family transcriptional regulator